MVTRSNEPDATRLLEQLRQGSQDAVDRLMPLVYSALKEIARRQLSRHERSSTLCTTELVHEAYFKLARQRVPNWRDRAHFCGIAAHAMRQVLVDHARSRSATKRAGGAQPITLTASHSGVEPSAIEVLALDEALDRLDRLNERLRRVVEYRFFGGMTDEEVAAVLGVSTRTVERDWLKAKLFLHRELHREDA